MILGGFCTIFFTFTAAKTGKDGGSEGERKEEKKEEGKKEREWKEEEGVTQRMFLLFNAKEPAD